MDAYVDDDTFDELDYYSKGSFLYEGQIYMRVGASEKEIIKGLKSIFNKHPDDDVKLKAVYEIVVMLMEKIHKKYC